MTSLGLTLIALPLLLLLYTYVGYPALLRLIGVWRPVLVRREDPNEWPFVSVSLPAFNEEGVIRETLEAWLAIDYPRDKLQIVVTSDASTDRTDEIVEGFRDRGVELVRLKERGGKTAAENAAAPRLRGEIIVNTDASVRVRPDSLKPLVRAFGDPAVGVASGRDISIGDERSTATAGEGGYVGYEMRIRALETRAGGIIGASGCYYAIRPELHASALPGHLSRDFAAPLIAREHGCRSVSVDDAICLVPRTGSLRAEFRRKVRTMARGLQTLWHKRRLLNPFAFGRFAWKLASHKVCRWLVPLVMPLAFVGLLLLASTSTVARGALAIALVGLALGTAGLVWPETHRRPRFVSLAGFALAANLAAVLGWVRALRRGPRDEAWEPTRRHAMGRTPE